MGRSLYVHPGTRQHRGVRTEGLSMAGVALIVGGLVVLGADVVAMIWGRAGLEPALTSVWDLLPSILRPFAPDPYVDLLQAFPLSLALITLGAALYRPSWPRQRTHAATQNRTELAGPERRLAA
ncbi:MAG TPA: hypothetical protein VMG58_07875 [Candidatus Sulfotelmatobacter sp.]|nr:hypothetical protein [Candidatus Sulfotelmatobacter sp.]